MLHSELRLLGPYRAPLKLTLGLNTPIYDTRVCVGTKETLTLPYICRNKAAICGWIFKLPDIFFFLFFYATFLRDCRDCRAL